MAGSAPVGPITPEQPGRPSSRSRGPLSCKMTRVQTSTSRAVLQLPGLSKTRPKVPYARSSMEDDVSEILYLYCTQTKSEKYDMQFQSPKKRSKHKLLSKGPRLASCTSPHAPRLPLLWPAGPTEPHVRGRHVRAHACTHDRVILALSRTARPDQVSSNPVIKAFHTVHVISSGF